MIDGKQPVAGNTTEYGNVNLSRKLVMLTCAKHRQESRAVARDRAMSQ